jgi:hypothetical protein
MGGSTVLKPFGSISPQAIYTTKFYIPHPENSFTGSIAPTSYVFQFNSTE